MNSEPPQSHVPDQLPLSIGLRDDATFGNFLTQHNLQVKQAVEALVGCGADGSRPLPKATGLEDLYLYLWGPAGCGCSHLLQAACHALDEQGALAIYLPLDELIDFGPAVLDGMETMELVCIDHLQAIAGDDDWERALFHLFNRIRDSGNKLLIAADQPPIQLPIQLADLSSRLRWGLVFQLQTLDDAGKAAALRLRAKGRGIELSEEVSQYIIHRSPRAMGSLFSILERLDRASLTAKRKVTIPFVKETLGW